MTSQPTDIHGLQQVQLMKWQLGLFGFQKTKGYYQGKKSHAIIDFKYEWPLLCHGYSPWHQ